MKTLITACTHALDTIEAFWHSETTHKTVSYLLVIIFLASLVLIEFNRHGMLPGMLAAHVSHSHFMAINIAFLLVLFLEIITMIFTLPDSMSKALGKQFEILALIFLRNAFKQLSDLPEPVSLAHHADVVYHIFAYGFGSLAIFGLLGCYRMMLTRLDKTMPPGSYLNQFILAKKIVAFCMLWVFFAMGIYDLWLKIQGMTGFNFFQSFYTVLIFSDILMVFLAQIFLPQFHAVFRNSGYALATLLIRLSLTASVYYSVAIGLSSVVFALLLTIIYNQFYSHSLHDHWS